MQQRDQPTCRGTSDPALRKEREGRGTHFLNDASEIKSLGHPPSNNKSKVGQPPAANLPSFLRFGLRGLLLWPRAAFGRDDTVHPQVLDHLTVVILRMEGADNGDCETR